MIQKKSLLNTIKRALQTGTFNYVGQEVKEFPKDLFRIDSLQFDDQSWWDCLPIAKMDLSNNLITQLPAELLQFPDLQLIRMKNNLVQIVPSLLVELQILKSLDLSKNRLTELPKQLSRFPALVELNVSENSITSLPDLQNVGTLQLLFINDNKIRKLPILGQNLKKLQAASNLIGQIRVQTFKRCSKLQIINLNKNQIEVVENQSFINTKNLVSLELKENKIAKFTEIPFSAKLDTIALSFNRLSQFTEFEKCPNLTVLILNDNKIRLISRDIIRLQKLKTLDLSNNDLPDLPSELGFINSLVRIQLQGNPLKAIRQNIRAGGTNAVKKYLQERMDPQEKAKIQGKFSSSLQHVSQGEYWVKLINQFNQNGDLTLRNMNLTDLDDLVYSKNLKTLNVSDNKLASLSDKVQNLSTLKTLILNSNQITHLPQSLQVIKTLETLEVKNNRLMTFPPFSRNPFYSSLSHLDLSSNRIAEFPHSILQLHSLRTLHLCFNKLKTIEPLFNGQYLLKLEILDVSNNQLEDIQDLVFQKHSLNYLNLENNNLTKLPTVLGFMKLLGLKVDGNPLKLIKRQVIEKGTVALMDHLRNKHTGDPPIKAPLKKEQNSQNIQEERYEDYERFQGINQQKQHIQQARQIRQDFTTQDVKKQVVNKKEDKQFTNLLHQIQDEIKQLERELQNNPTMNNFQRNQRRKRIQALMIQRNKMLR